MDDATDRTNGTRDSTASPQTFAGHGGGSVSKPFRILLDLDDTISYNPAFFAMFTRLMRSGAEIHVVTSRPEEQRQETIDDLAKFGIVYDKLALTWNKLEYALENGINVVFEDDDHFFKYMPETITVFKIREAENWDWKSRRWIYDDKSGVHMEDLP